MDFNILKISLHQKWIFIKFYEIFGPRTFFVIVLQCIQRENEYN